MSSKYIMGDGKRVYVALRQDHTSVLLSVSNDCNFKKFSFLIGIEIKTSVRLVATPHISKLMLIVLISNNKEIKLFFSYLCPWLY